MKRFTIRLGLSMLTLSLLTACGVNQPPTPTMDSGVLMTQIAQTVVAEITRNALLSPSATPSPTETPIPMPTAVLPTIALPLPGAGTQTGNTSQVLPAGSPDSALFAGDVTVADGTVFYANESFTKKWKLLNNGTTTWNIGYKLVYVDGKIISEILIVSLTKPVAPGESIEIGVSMKAPSALGSYTTWWRMMNDKGQFFGDAVSVQFTVSNTKNAGATATPAG